MSQLECAESQLAEMELLSSMFPTEREFEVTDHVALAELRGAVENASCGSPPPLSRPRFLLRQTCHGGVDLTLCCTYPFDYPTALPEINVRCTDLSRAQQTRLQADLTEHLQEHCRGDVCVLTALEWVKEHAERYLHRTSSCSSAGGEESARGAEEEVEVFSRLWIYSHHIYNRSKRKNILEWARELGLTGFSMPGKPGIVCVEGPQPAAEEFWSRVKVLTWKRIMLRHREDVTLGGEGRGRQEGEGGVASLRKFSGFEEASFDPHGNRGNHMDLGLLYQFLSERGCPEVFQMYFGVEGR